MKIPPGAPLTTMSGRDAGGGGLTRSAAWHLPRPSRARALAPVRRTRGQERRDEWLSAVVHAGAGLATLAAVPTLLIQASTWPAVLAGGVFLLALLATFSFSAWLHLTGVASAQRRWLGLFDRCAIFALIAGTYTPLAALNLPAPWQGTVLATVWLLAVAGIAVNTYGFYRLRGFDRLEPLNLVLYLGQGWSGPVALAPVFWAALSNPTLAWLAAGGLAYSVGVVFYCWPSLAYHHTTWHLFVVAGAACHAWAVLAYAVPAG